MKVGVIIPVYNAAPFLEQAVDSALSQHETVEVILAEDCSTDDSLSVCRHLAECHSVVRLVRHPGGVNMGAGASRNLGIRSSTSNLLAFLDADDYYLPDRFAYPHEIFTRDDSVDGVYQCIGVHCEDEESRRKLDSFGLGEVTMLTREVPPEKLADALIAGECGSFSLDALVVKRDIFEKCGYFFEELRLHQDTAMTVQLACFGRLVPGSLTEPVAIRRVHGGNRYLARYDNLSTGLALWNTLFYWALQKQIRAERKAAIFLNRQYLLSKILSRGNGLLLSSLLKLVLGSAAHPFLSVRALRARRFRGR